MLHNTESANNQKLMIEYEKYQELQAKSQKMQEYYDRKLQEMERERETAMAELTQDYKIRIEEKINQLEQVCISCSRIQPTIKYVIQFTIYAYLSFHLSSWYLYTIYGTSSFI